MRRNLLVAVALALAACGQDGSAGPIPSPIPGSYNLTMVDGQVLPINVVDLGAYKAYIVSGTLDLNSDGTYYIDFDVRVEDSGNIRTQTLDDVGLWNVMDDSITLASTRGSISRTGTLSGDAITLQSGGRVLVLRK
jgi:hypothetical protein